MPSAKAVVLVYASLASAAGFSGASALQYTARAVALGPRPPGSEAHRKLQTYILSELRRFRCQVEQDAFTARTPLGPLPMKNIIARFPGASGRAVAITGHYDTKSMPGRTFVGANDGGSSTGFLLEMARTLSTRPRRHDVYLVWFDGEEALVQWSESDSLYGSRHLARRWSQDGTLRRLIALINVDMIGDRDLGLVREAFSTLWLREGIWQIAAELGYGRHFLNDVVEIEDDHLPFLRAGVPAVNLIDFDYGPGHSWWHTERDTLDKLSARSFQVVGDVILEWLRRLERENHSAHGGRQ
ncbi:MAG: M28 family peptidase [Bryobacterales bacterium]|nr:M28 family peptidase [Bryobacteraceae bacterium]MDW8355986.1 M28 family peptidase [Bryobacterales bacterium]